MAMRQRLAAFVFLTFLSPGLLHAQIVDVEAGGANAFRDRTSRTTVTRIHEGDAVQFVWPSPQAVRLHNVFPFAPGLSRSGSVTVAAGTVMTMPSATEGDFTSAWDPDTRSRPYQCTLHNSIMNGRIYVYERAQSFTVQAPAEVVMNRPFSVTVTAVGAGGTTDRIYEGTVGLSSPETDGGMQLPPDHEFTRADSGSYRFDGLVLTAPGPRTIDVVQVGGGIAAQVALDVVACRPHEVFESPIFSPIVIPDPQASFPGTSGKAKPYPASIELQGVNGPITRVTVTLHEYWHQRPEDVDILLVGPGGEEFLILSDLGSSQPVPPRSPVTLLLTDTPPLGSTTSIRPTNIGSGGDTFPAPAPPPSYRSPAPAGSATFTNTFAGHSGNGTWSLYVFDDQVGSVGYIAGGWSLALDVTCP
jgi:hypothetical protein